MATKYTLAAEMERFTDRVLAEHTTRHPKPANVVDACVSLRRIAIKLHRSYETACNREQRPSELREETRLEARAKAIVASFGPGFKLTIQGDPRGAPMIIGLPSGYSDDFGGRGLVVPYLGITYYRASQSA